MEQRYGAWAQLLVLFRLIHGGVNDPELSIPAREGYLFDPAAYPFLEGRTDHADHDPSTPTDMPRISDQIVYRVLEKLMLLDGQRLSYRTLDVEQIGSVYETMIGFELMLTDVAETYAGLHRWIQRSRRYFGSDSYSRRRRRFSGISCPPGKVTKRQSGRLP